MSRSPWHNPILLSILAAVLTLGLKFAAYAVTGSVGLLSDALESTVNLVAAVTSLFCMRYAALPVDETHTYGHEKIEFFASGLEGVLILVAGGGIGWYAVRRLLEPAPLESLGVGVAISLVASAVNGAVGLALLRIGRARRSIVLEADGRHLLTDVWTSLGVVTGLVLVRLTGVYHFDPLIALLVACNILWTGFRLVRLSFDGLMDHALPAAEQEQVRAAIESQLGPDMDYHALRTRVAGSRRFADFHLLVPGRLSVGQAHEIAERIESVVGEALPGTEVTVHVEPIEEQASWQDSALVPLEQAARREQQGRPEERPPG